MTRARCLPLVAALLLLAGLVSCSSSAPAAGEQWSRTYAAPLDRVWQAATATLAEQGYGVEGEDREQGRIRAQSWSDPAYRAISVELRIRGRGELVVVDVQARGGAMDVPPDYRRVGQAVDQLLVGLDQRLVGPGDED